MRVQITDDHTIAVEIPLNFVRANLWIEDQSLVVCGHSSESREDAHKQLYEFVQKVLDTFEIDISVIGGPNE